MIGFEVSINKEKNYKVGVKSGAGVLTSIVDWTKRKQDDIDEVSISIQGLNSDDKNHLMWTKQKLKVGDTIVIKIIDEKEFDAPTELRQPEKNNNDVLQSKIKYFHQLKEELKDHV